MSKTVGATPEVSLYVHVPICRARCDYCDFFARIGTSEDRRKTLVHRTLDQLETMLMHLRPETVPTVYVGGGTPSALGTGLLSELLTGIDRRIRAVAAQPGIIEWTVEVNPADLTVDLLECLQAAGVNRLSLGIQSFSDHLLARIGRVGSEHRVRALELIADRWTGSWSADLMVALPGQSEAELRSDLTELIRRSPPHISLYELTIEPHTVLGLRKRRNRLAASRVAVDRAYRFSAEFLSAAGYEHYEVSNFARNGHYGRHNIRYWELLPYLGVGPSAVSTLPRADGGAVRLSVAPSLERFAADPTYAVTEEALSAGDLVREFWMVGLRTTHGIEVNRHRRIFGVDPHELLPATFKRWADHVELTPDRVALHASGRAVLDAVLRDAFLELDTTERFIETISWP